MEICLLSSKYIFLLYYAWLPLTLLSIAWAHACNLQQSDLRPFSSGCKVVGKRREPRGVKHIVTSSCSLDKYANAHVLAWSSWYVSRQGCWPWSSACHGGHFHTENRIGHKADRLLCCEQSLYPSPLLFMELNNKRAVQVAGSPTTVSCKYSDILF